MIADLRYALRALRRSPGFAAAAVLTLALGIGANAALFSVVNSVLLRRLPYPNPDQLVLVSGRYPVFGRTATSMPDFRDWRDRTTRSFAQMAARHGTAFNLTGQGEPERLVADRVTANFFPTLGVRPVLGRGFLPEEDRVGGDDDVVVLSHAFWQRRFGGDRSIVGRSIQLSGRPYTVIGIAPANFRFGRAVDLWAPTRTDSTAGPTAQRRSEFLDVFGRLNPGVSAAQAGSELAGVVRRLAEQYPETNGALQAEVVGLQDDLVSGARPAILAFMGAVGMVLLIACANVANLLLARAATREREVAVRIALGAGRARLVRQILTESALLSLLGGALGLMLAMWAVASVRAASVQFIPRQSEVAVDATVVLFSLALAVVTGVVFGLAPVARLAGSARQGMLREGARGSTGSGAATRVRSALVLGEVAVALVLLVGAGLLIRSFEKLSTVDVGFDASGVLTYRVLFPSAKYSDVEQLPALYSSLLERTRAIPDVQSAAVSGDMPMGGAGYITVAVEGRAPRAAGADATAAPEDVQPIIASSDYFAALRIPLRRGRFLQPADDAGSPRVVVISDEMVRRFFTDGRDPVGRRITFDDPADTAAVWRTVVGVVGNVAQEGVTARPYAQVYMPIAQEPTRNAFVLLRTAGDPLAVAPAARRALAAIDRDLPISDLRTLADRVSENIARPRVSVLLLTAFAWLALTLAAIGIYGVVAYSVVQRTREIGVRMALGATPGDVLRLVICQGMRPTLVGVAVGLAGALAASRLIESLLYGVSAVDPLTFLVVPLFLVAVALLATYVPARRATRVPPGVALQGE